MCPGDIVTGTDTVPGPLNALKGNLGLPCPCLGFTTVEQGITLGKTGWGHIPAQLGHGRLCYRWCGFLYDNPFRNAWKWLGNGAEGSVWVHPRVGIASQNMCFNGQSGAPESPAQGIPHAQHMRYLLGRNTSAAVTASLQTPPSLPSCQGPAFLQVSAGSESPGAGMELWAGVEHPHGLRLCLAHTCTAQRCPSTVTP